MCVVTPSKSFTTQQSLIQSVCIVAKISRSHPTMCILSVLIALASLLFTRNSLLNTIIFSLLIIFLFLFFTLELCVSFVKLN